MNFSCKTQKLNKETFVLKAREIHKDLYDYSEFIYVGSHIKGKIKCCKNQHVFEQRPYSHLNGKGCQKCAKIKLGNLKRSDKEEFVIKAKVIHGALYDYSEFVYINSQIKGKIICKKHEMIFKQTPASHLFGRGCPECGNDKKNCSNKEEFIEKATKIHDELYDYSSTEYIDSRTKIKIICKLHNFLFNQTPSDHLSGCGCPKCSHTISKPEIKWLDSLNIPLRQYKIKLINEKFKKVDGYNPSTNTIYEFHGDYYHGNPKKHICPVIWNQRTKKFMRELYQNTLKSNKLIIDSGYNLITIWEKEYYELC